MRLCLLWSALTGAYGFFRSAFLPEAQAEESGENAGAEAETEAAAQAAGGRSAPPLLLLPSDAPARLQLLDMRSRSVVSTLDCDREAQGESGVRHGLAMCASLLRAGLSSGQAVAVVGMESGAVLLFVVPAAAASSALQPVCSLQLHKQPSQPLSTSACCRWLLRC